MYTLSYIDLDKSETHTIYAELDPGWAWNYFALNSTSRYYTLKDQVVVSFNNKQKRQKN